MPKTPEELEKLKVKRKENIITAGLKIFCEKGYEGATVDDIVKKAECSHGLFYHYFKSKKEIFNAVIENAQKHSDKTVENILALEISATEKLRKIISFLFDDLSKNELKSYYFYFFFSLRFLIGISGVKPEPPKNRKPLFLLFETVIKEGMEKGEFKNDYPLHEYAKILHSIMQGVTMAYIVIPKDLKQNFNPPAVDLIVDIFKKN